MVERRIEDGRHLALRLAVANKAAIAARAERKGEGIEQDGFPGAGLAGQNAEALTKPKFEPVDQNDVADRELNEHSAAAYSPRRTVRVVRPCALAP